MVGRLPTTLGVYALLSPMGGYPGVYVPLLSPMGGYPGVYTPLSHPWEATLVYIPLFSPWEATLVYTTVLTMGGYPGVYLSYKEASRPPLEEKEPLRKEASWLLRRREGRLCAKRPLSSLRN